MPKPLSLVIQQIPWKEIHDHIQTVEDYHCLLRELCPLNWGRRVVCVLVTCFLGFRLPSDHLWTLYEQYVPLQKEKYESDAFKCSRETHSPESLALSFGYF